MESKVAVVISSCDKYSYLWDIQIQFFEKHWSHCPYDIYLISDLQSYPYSNFGNLKIRSFPSNKISNGASDWSINLSSFLEKHEYEYIIYFQDDYIPYKKVDQKRLDTLIKYVKSNDINYVRFYTAPPGNGNTIVVDDAVSIKEIIENTQYRHSLMVSLWKSNTLLQILKKMNSIDPWNFEKSNASSGYDKFYCLDIPTYDSSDIINFYGMYGSSNGHSFYPFIVDLINSEGITKLSGDPIDFSIKL